MTPLPRLVKNHMENPKKTKKPKAPEPGLVKTIGKTKKTKNTKVLRAQWLIEPKSGVWELVA